MHRPHEVQDFLNFSLRRFVVFAILAALSGEKEGAENYKIHTKLIWICKLAEIKILKTVVGLLKVGNGQSLGNKKRVQP